MKELKKKEKRKKYKKKMLLKSHHSLKICVVIINTHRRIFSSLIFINIFNKITEYENSLKLIR